MADELEMQLVLVQRAARRGAVSATKDRQVVEDAVDAATARWQDAVLNEKPLQNEEAWAFRVGLHAARGIGRKRRRSGPTVWASDRQPVESTRQAGGPASDPEVPELRVLQGRLPEIRECLTPRQFQIVRVLSRGGVSFHQAAKELGMDRSNLKRVFHAALRRLANAMDGLPPPLQADRRDGAACPRSPSGRSFQQETR